ncbi:MAG TPA: 2-phospho-L-lactate guanylyltransferase [Candidatus Nitrosotenuis sp.]|nr:2-phospho-L-lactate guanylyltransferase [Candidatus Nitrosotenuis sp.]
MRAVLIPVKDLRLAKQRLAPWLSQTARTELATAMLRDVFAAVAAARCVEDVFVVSNCEAVLEMAKRCGWNVLQEAQQFSESASVDWASRSLAERGVQSALRLPIDVPLVQAADVEDLFEAAESSACVIVPSRDGTGTNALLRTPPNLFPSHFGPNSLQKHLAEARRAGVAACVLQNHRLALDVDDGEDLRALAPLLVAESETAGWLARHAEVLAIAGAQRPAVAPASPAN